MGNDTASDIKNRKVKILIGIPTEGKTESEAYENRLSMMYHLGKLSLEGKFEFIQATTGRIFVAKARDMLAEVALREDVNADYIFSIDDDMLSQVDIFEKLYRHFEKGIPDMGIVGALCFMRRTPYYPVLYVQRNGWDNVRHQPYFMNEIVKNYPKNALFEIDAIGFGCVLIKTDIIRKMQKPYFMSTTPNGEDIWFCSKAKQEANARIFVDTSVEVLHLGAPIIVGEKQFEEANNMDKIRALNPEYKPEYWASERIPRKDVLKQEEI